ncbi:helix-turn-helix domain-containing protein [Actinomadura sp. 3N508]|uniref:helix-turn-helix domain-containing protein n=1 Tax=Actinomadura sp. 3N508 TaxID=3375153 RepID=UPI00379B1D2E
MAEITRTRPLKPVDPVKPAGEAPHEPAAPAPEAEPLWRDALGHCLRRLRLERGETLVETSRRAGVSPQYLSEMERGVKEPSSEMIAAVAGALDVTLGDLTLAIATTLLTSRAAAVPARTTGVTCQATAYALAA